MHFKRNNDLVTQFAEPVGRGHRLLLQPVLVTTQACHGEVVHVDTEDELEDMMPCPELVCEDDDDPEPKPDDIQLIELEVERPRPILPSGISYIFEFSSYSHESVVSFISLDSIESLSLLILSFSIFSDIPKKPNSTYLATSRNKDSYSLTGLY